MAVIHGSSVPTYPNMLNDMAVLRDTLREFMSLDHRSSAWSYIRGDDHSIWCSRSGGIRYFYTGIPLDIEYIPAGHSVAQGWYLVDTAGHSPGEAAEEWKLASAKHMATYDIGPFETLQRAATTLYHLLTMHSETIGG